MSNLRRILSNLLAVVAGLSVAVCILTVAGVLLMSADLSWLPAVRLVPQQDERQARFAARFQRQQEAAVADEDVGPVRCVLTPWNGPAPNDDPAPDLRLELTNTATESVCLWYTSGAECHVTFLIYREPHAICGSFCYGTLSPLPVGFNAKTNRPEPLPPVLTLQAGETYSAGVRLLDLRNGCSGPGAAGAFQLEAVFLYEDIEGYPVAGQRFVARSQSVGIVVGKSEDETRLSWRLHRP
jgi:hypothetical protein